MQAAAAEICGYAGNFRCFFGEALLATHRELQAAVRV
jgi:hypothetical protein